MINLQKVDNKNKVQQPGIMMFASPAITPSNNYKAGNIYQKDSSVNNSSQIHGRKCDSPQLRVMRDQYDSINQNAIGQTVVRSQIPNNNANLPQQLKKDDYLQLYNYHNQIRELNNTNKEIQKKQFDFNINKHKANITIQYDNSNEINYSQHISNKQNKHNLVNALNNTQIESNNNRHHKPSKSQKRRQQSQSVPRHHQPSASIVNNQAQPLINLHISNAKVSTQNHSNNNKLKTKRGVASNSQIPQKYHNNNSSSGQQSVQQKSRSKSKNRQKSYVPTNNILNNHVHNYNSQLPPGTQQRSAFMAQATKEILNYSSNNLNNQSKIKNSFMFSFDNKENESINYNEFSPSRIIGKHPQQYNQNNPAVQINNFLESESSDNDNTEKQIQQKLEKQYFLDKSTLLKHLSPERNKQNSKTRITNKSGHGVNQSIIPQQILSDRDAKSMGNQNYLSNGSTIVHSNLNDSAINKTANQSLVNIKFKKQLSSGVKNSTALNGSQANQKIIMKGVDKLIKENLKRNKTKEEEDISKKYLEEFKQKLKKNELTNRNHQVRKINASKIMYNHQHKNSQVNGIGRQNLNLQQQQLLLQQKISNGYKKQRSKSCMNKTDNIFNNNAYNVNHGGYQGNNGPRSKERIPAARNELNIQQQMNENKKEKKREKSFVLEIRDLQKQIDGEIRREIMQGKLDIQPTSTANKRTNLTTINAKKDINNIPSNKQNKKDLLNFSVIDNNQYIKKSNDELLLAHENFTGKRKSKSKDKNKSISQNIKKFMEKKKNTQQQLKSLEQTIENKKNQKIKENLKSLHQFAKQHFRHQSFNFYPKKKQDFNPVIGLSQNESGHALPIKKLKPQFFKKKQKKSTERQQQSKKNFDFRGDGETIFDNEDITPNQFIDRYDPANNGDVSREFFEDYQNILKSIQKHQKQQARDSSNSNDRSNSNGGNRKHNMNQKQKKQTANYKPQSQLQSEFETSALLERKLRDSNKDNYTISIDQSRYTSIKNDNIYVPSVVQEKGASLIPPQSEIATLDRNHLDKSQQLKAQQEQKRYSDVRRSHDSSKTNGRSPKHSEQKSKVKILMNKYGHNLPKSQVAASSADTKLLIKLHSAAITIQQHFRNHLQDKGFYDNESSDPQSQMYVDSEEDHNDYQQYIDTTEKKSTYQKQLIANTSPLRVKAKYQQNGNNLSYQQIQHKLQPQLLPQQKGNKFYSEDSSDVEKVIVCSVITSVRADNEQESLSNTQKYIPLRQKLQLPTGKAPLQQSLISQHQKIPSSTSSAQSQLNTVIKTNQQIPIQQRLKQEQQPPEQQSIDNSQPSSSSQRKKLVPSLDFGKLNTISQKEEEEKKQEAIPKILKPISTQDEEMKHHDQGSNTARSVFDRNTFQDFQQKINHGEAFNMNNYPEMIKMREEAIKFREMEEQKHLQKMVKTQQMSPRTYDRKCKELETWVTKEKEEVKKTRKVFEEQWKKTAQIIEQTQKNQENMKKLLNENNTHQMHQQHQPASSYYNQMYQITKTHESLPSENTLGAPIISHRLSSRREDSTRLLDMIDDYKQQDPYMDKKDQQALLEQSRKLKEQQELHQKQKDQERIQAEIERKKEIELLKEQERQRDQERQKRIQEEERKRREEQERQEKLREAERQRLLQQEKEKLIQLEKEKLKKEEEERQRKQREAEEKRQREQQELKKKQEQEEIRRQEELKAQKLREEEAERQRKLKEKQEEDARIKKLKEEEEQKRQQKLKEEQDRQIALQRQKEEEERQRKQEELRKQQLIQQQKLAEEEKLRKLQKEKEEQEERERQLLKQKQQKEAEEQEQRRQQQLLNEKAERERKEKEEQERKQKEEQEELERLQREQQAAEILRKQQQKLIEEQQQRYNQSKSSDNDGDDAFINSEEEEDDFAELLQSDSNTKQGKEILESVLTDNEPYILDTHNKSQNPNNLGQYFMEDSPQSSSSKSRQDQLLASIGLGIGGQGISSSGKIDDNRQLQRTTSSQNLDHRSLEAYNQYKDDNNDNNSDTDDVLDAMTKDRMNNNSSQMRTDSPYDNQQHPSTSKLNDDSFDEEKLNNHLLERQEKQNQQIHDIIKKENYFSQGFDDQKHEDLLNTFQRTLEETKNIDMTLESKLTNPTIDKIVVHDESEYDMNNQEVIEPTFNNARLTHQMRSQIPVEQEELNPHGLPVSPVSTGGNDIRITTGAQSLESTISDGEQIKNAIIEANRNNNVNIDTQLGLLQQFSQSPTSSPQAENQQTDLDKQAELITDDIFRQLMAEMKVDLDLLLLTDPRRLFKEETTNQNQFLSESGRFLIFERRGIKTDLFAIERYVEEILDEILKDQSRFTSSIQQPISKNAREVLNQLQNSEIGSYEHFESNYPVVLPLDLYLRLERRRKENREKELLDETRDQSLTQQQVQDRNFLAECEHIHNKVLFDCINDSLLQFKPYGKDGMPLPWSRQNRRLKPIEEFTVEEMFEIVKHDLFRWAIMQAGTLPRREFVFNNLFDDELFAEIREKKLATLLAREMIENEPKWLNYEFEEAQVKIDIGDMILEQLVTETITILKKNEALGSNLLDMQI